MTGKNLTFNKKIINKKIKKQMATWILKQHFENTLKLTEPTGKHFCRNTYTHARVSVIVVAEISLQL